MLEYESSFVGLPTRKRFHAYVALFDYENNDENLDIIFCVITTKEKSKIVKHKIGDTDCFQILIFNINDLGFEKIISNANYKIEKQEEFSVEELVELALTSLMPEAREDIIKQFYKLSEMMDSIKFEDEEAKVSFSGIVLLLSNIYFEKNDSIRKKIQGVFMGKVDCIVEMREEQFNDGFNDGLLVSARILLENGFSLDEVSKKTGLDISKLEKLNQNMPSSK